MNSYFLKKIPSLKILMGILLLLQLAACGSNTTSQLSYSSSNSTPIPSPDPTSTPTSDLPSSPPEAFYRSPSLRYPANIGAFTTSQNLRIAYSWAGCGMNNNLTNIVLTTNRLAYDSGEIQQMSNYLDTVSNITNNDPLTMPSTLQYALGFFPGKIANWGLDNSPNKCGLEMSVTNMGNTIIQINHVSLRMVKDALPNSYRYRLIDVCSLPLANKASMCPLGRGAAGGAYIYNYKLGAEKADTIVESASFTPGLIVSKSGTLILGKSASIFLNPGDTSTIAQIFEEKDSTSDYIYSIMPELSLGTADNQQIIDLNQLTGHIAFLNPETQSMCYQLKGENFVPIDNNATPQVSNSTSTSIDTNVNCI